MTDALRIRLGIFGGSFNPPHIAHQMLLAAALGCGELDIVWMIPTFEHAFGKDLAPYGDRVAMCERVAAPFGGRVIVSRLEEELGGQSRTLRLLERTAELVPEASLRLVVGADILAEADKWHRWDDVVALAPPLVFGREGEAPVEGGIGNRLTIPGISSTETRQRLAAGLPCDALLPEAVARYIVARGLYRASTSP